jgi:predicted CXXCH cytochrome family protein
MAGRRYLRVRRAWAALAFALASLPGAAAAAMPEDLALGREGFSPLSTEPIPNPHASIACVRCHTKAETSYDVARRFGIRMPLITEGESSILLCEQCHKDYHVFHPVNFPVKKLADAVARAEVFPLETPVEGYNKLTCTSCHAVHFPHTANRLLRGFPVDDLVGGAPFRTRLDFCRSCHGAEALVELSGHRTSTGETGCGLCHGARGAGGSIGPLKRSLNLTCAVCHPPAAGEVLHFANYNPFPGQPPPATGRWTCASCHVHHRPGAEANYFTPSFLAAVAKSTRVNPHLSTRFCLSCHPAAPPPPGTPGAAAPLVQGDLTLLCQGCHAREGALQMHHPLRAPTKETAGPADWPLRADGTLGCQTCHRAGHGPRDPDNPRFLRGGPYRQRNEVCSHCHAEERLRGRDIHAEIAESRGCDLCHLPVATDAATAAKAGPLRAEPTLLCLQCHAVPPHPASAEHTVRPRPSTFLVIDEKKAPLTLGKVTCTSCHEVHGTASPQVHLLRAAGRAAICGNCHPF